jgi:hypothetical protein
MEVFLIVVALILFASLQNRVDERHIHEDYEAWKNNRR